MTGPTGDSEEEEDGGRQGGAAETGEVCVCVCHLLSPRRMTTAVGFPSHPPLKLDLSVCFVSLLFREKHRGKRRMTLQTLRLT